MVKLTANCRGYKTMGDRKRAVSQLAKKGYNSFVFYQDTNSSIALMYSKAVWIPKNRIVIQ
jgi:hypothetical protein